MSIINFHCRYQQLIPWTDKVDLSSFLVALFLTDLMLQFLIKTPNFGKFNQPFPYAIYIDKAVISVWEKINDGKTVLLSWLIALFDTYYYPPVPDQGTRFKQTTIYMIIQLFHPLNRRNHLYLIQRGREIIGEEEQTGFKICWTACYILTFSALFAVFLNFMDHSLLI